MKSRTMLVAAAGQALAHAEGTGSPQNIKPSIPRGARQKDAAGLFAHELLNAVRASLVAADTTASDALGR